MERISGRQLVLIGGAYILNATLVSVPSQIIDVARMNGWLSYVMAMGIMAGVIWLISKVTERFAGKDLFDSMVERFPFWGRIAALGYVLFFFIILCRDIRMISDFIDLSLLPKTPLIIISFLIVITVVRIARGGIEIIARMTEIWFPVLIILLLLIPAALFKDLDFRYMKPFFEHGVMPSVIGGWYAISYIGEAIALPFIFTNNTFQFRRGFAALLIGTTCLIIINFATILSLGTLIPGRLMYPTYEMVRQIRVTDFLDRFDLPIVGIYLPSMLTKIALNLFIVGHGISRAAPALLSKQIMLPVGALAYVCSFWFYRNALQLYNLNRTWPAFALVFELLVPILLFFFLRNKSGSGQNAARKTGMKDN